MSFTIINEFSEKPNTQNDPVNQEGGISDLPKDVMHQIFALLKREASFENLPTVCKFFYRNFRLYIQKEAFVFWQKIKSATVFLKNLPIEINLFKNAESHNEYSRKIESLTKDCEAIQNGVQTLPMFKLLKFDFGRKIAEYDIFQETDKSKIKETYSEKGEYPELLQRTLKMHALEDEYKLGESLELHCESLVHDQCDFPKALETIQQSNLLEANRRELKKKIYLSAINDDDVMSVYGGNITSYFIDSLISSSDLETALEYTNKLKDSKVKDWYLKKIVNIYAYLDLNKAQETAQLIVDKQMKKDCLEICTATRLFE